jgi:FlaA1/EpsC-like NDP-sugar epimerase
MPELRNILVATTSSTLGFIATGLIVPPKSMPRSVYMGEWLTSIVLVGGVRFLIRIVREHPRTGVNRNAIATLIVGAADAGESLLRDVQRHPEGKWSIVGFLDDDPIKQGAIMRDVRVFGPADEATLRRVIAEHDVKLVVLAIPAADGRRVREIVSICRRLRVETKTIPSLPDRFQRELGFSAVREVAIEDLLRRDPVRLDLEQVRQLISTRTLLVTGAGGSIGSELCRQALRFAPAKVLLFDHDENALFDIERELRSAFPTAPLVPLIGDVTDKGRVEQVFRRFRPDVVLHAAAHKHVPMMEANACEAVKNNIFGTSIMAAAAEVFGALAFVMISTDKAVNPTSVMGATKRVAEMIIQARAGISRTTRFVAVRFGNVLGSNGSVVPLFREQIGRGGPITITHPEVRRYFMTIPEATQLVLQAAALGEGGEIFVLDMGEPIKIVNLARDMIELSGLTPDVDITIQFTGLRPGEKLFEELLLSNEGYDRTPHPKIVVGRIQPTPSDVLKKALTVLEAAANRGDEASVRLGLAQLVPESSLTLPAAPSETTELEARLTPSRASFI